MKSKDLLGLAPSLVKLNGNEWMAVEGHFKRWGFSVALITTTVLAQHPRSGHKGSTRIQTYAAVK